MDAGLMARPELHRTLMAAVEAISPPVDAGLLVTEIELTLPLEIVAGSRDGRPVIAGGVPHTRWRSGVLPAVHTAHLRIVLTDRGDGSPTPTRHRGQ
jgi:hypothetical protein